MKLTALPSLWRTSMVMMKSSQGTTVSVSEDKAKRLRSLGYLDANQSAPQGTSAPKKRARSKKATEDKTLDEMVWDDEAGG